MRVSKEQAAANRARILEEASRLFRERGFDGVGVDALAEAAGLTHGGLYSRFGSKEALAEQALSEAMRQGSIARAMAQAEQGRDRGEVIADLLGRYLSPRHRDSVGQGCPLAALGCEIPRQSAALRAIFTEGLRSRIEGLAGLLPGETRPERDTRAMTLLSGMVGALVLARAVDDATLSDALLSAVAQGLREAVAGDAPGDRTAGLT